MENIGKPTWNEKQNFVLEDEFLFQRVNVQLRVQCSLFGDLAGTFTYIASRDVDILPSGKLT